MRQPIYATAGALAASVIVAAALTVSAPARAATGDAELTCLAQTIYFEARGATDKEKIAVGHVVLNRSHDSEFPDSICGVVHQKAKAGGCAFSWACDGRSDKPRDKDAWDESLSLAREVLADKVADPTEGALFFHSRKVKPEWKEDYKRTVVIGDLMFYTRGKQTAAAQ